ncbi:hypothetical protein GUITHDRAFT_75215, partial [Guillardia theta CCMP2712]
MYYKYNAVLRLPQSHKVNKYVTTLHCVVSGVIKLSKTTRLPSSRVVYRGLKGVRMPARFVEEDARGVSGGVEYGMLSTSTDRQVALQYAKEGSLPTLFEISCGAIDRGADVELLSQYPEEKEILYPPLSYLEVMK